MLLKHLYNEANSKTRYLAKNIKIKDINIRSYTKYRKLKLINTPNGESILVSSTGLPVLTGSWLKSEAKLLGIYQMMGAELNEILIQLPTRSEEQILKRCSSVAQISFTTEGPIFEKIPNFKMEGQKHTVKLSNGAIIEVSGSLLPSKLGKFSTFELEIYSEVLKYNGIKPHISQIMPTRSYLQFNSHFKTIPKGDNSNENPNLSATSRHGFIVKESRLSPSEVETLNLARYHYLDVLELSQFLPNRTLFQIYNSKDELFKSSTKSFKIVDKELNAEGGLDNQRLIHFTLQGLPRKTGLLSPEENLLLDFFQKEELNIYEMPRLMGTRTLAQISSYIKRKEKIINEGPWSPNEIELFKASIKKFAPETKEIDQFINTAKGTTFWAQVAKEVGTRTPSQCRYLWNFNVRPNIVKYVPFTKKEDDIILNKLLHGTPFSKIPNYLPGRNNNQIKTRAKSLLTKNRKTWSIEEIKLLLDGIGIYGLQNWKNVSKHVGTRNLSQCQHRYASNRYSLDFYISKKYSHITELDTFLILSLEKYLPKQLQTIAFLIPGYTINQIKYNFLLNSKNRKPQKALFKRRWEDSEASILYDMFLEHGADWDKISSYLPSGFTPEQCKLKIMITMTSNFTSSHLNILKAAIVEKYNEEKEKGMIKPKVRKYYDLEDEMETLRPIGANNNLSTL